MRDQMDKHAALLIPAQMHHVSSVGQPTIGPTNVQTEGDNSIQLTLTSTPLKKEPKC